MPFTIPEGDIILRESQRLEKILQRIMEYLRPMEFICEDCLANNVLTECLELLGSDMEHRGIKGRLNLDSSLSPVYVQDENVRILGAISEEVAHEIRNPLVSIGGFAKRLKR